MCADSNLAVYATRHLFSYKYDIWPHYRIAIKCNYMKYDRLDVVFVYAHYCLRLLSTEAQTIRRTVAGRLCSKMLLSYIYAPAYVHVYFPLHPG